MDFDNADCAFHRRDAKPRPSRSPRGWWPRSLLGASQSGVRNYFHRKWASWGWKFGSFLFWRYVNFSKIFTLPVNVTTFQCHFYVVFWKKSATISRNTLFRKQMFVTVFFMLLKSPELFCVSWTLEAIFYSPQYFFGSDICHSIFFMAPFSKLFDICPIFAYQARFPIPTFGILHIDVNSHFLLSVSINRLSVFPDHRVPRREDLCGHRYSQPMPARLRSISGAVRRNGENWKFSIVPDSMWLTNFIYLYAPPCLWPRCEQLRPSAHLLECAHLPLEVNPRPV